MGAGVSVWIPGLLYLMWDNFDVHIGVLTSLGGLSPSRILCWLPFLPGSLPSPLSSWNPLGLTPKAKACTGVPALVLFLEEPIWTLVRLLTFPLQVSMFPIFISDAATPTRSNSERKGLISSHSSGQTPSLMDVKAGTSDSESRHFHGPGVNAHRRTCFHSLVLLLSSLFLCSPAASA